MNRDRISQVARRIALLDDIFIHHERMAPLEQHLSIQLEKRLIDIEMERAREATGIALSGPSGAGKTTAIRYLIKKERQRLKDYGTGEHTIIEFRVQSPATLVSVGRALLGALGYGIKGERQAWYIWDLVRHHLKERRVLFVYLDEAQDLAERGTKHELSSVASMLKTLMTDEEWPVGIILSGTNELEDILNHDPQLARRIKPVHYSSLSPVGHSNDALDLLENYSSRVGLRSEAAAQDIALGERLVHAAANQLGLITIVILEAIQVALLEDSETLDPWHFAKAYQLRASCDEDFNPFIVPDFLRIDTREIFTRSRD